MYLLVIRLFWIFLGLIMWSASLEIVLSFLRQLSQKQSTSRLLMALTMFLMLMSGFGCLLMAWIVK